MFLETTPLTWPHEFSFVYVYFLVNFAFVDGRFGDGGSLE